MNEGDEYATASTILHNFMFVYVYTSHRILSDEWMHNPSAIVGTRRRRRRRWLQQEP